MTFSRKENEQGVKLWNNRGDARCEHCGSFPDRERWFWDWHQAEVPRNRYICNLDSLKYRIDNGKVRPVAMMEFSSMMPETEPTADYFESKKDQVVFKVLEAVGSTLGVEAYYVLHTDDKSTLYIYHIHEKGWPVYRYTMDQFKTLVLNMVVPRPEVWVASTG